VGTSEKILDIARIEFARHGLAGARVDRIASLAGVNKAMIYYHFRSKENLHRVVIDQELGKVKKLMEEAVAQETDAESAFCKLSELFTSMFEDQDNFVPMFLREIASGSPRFKNALVNVMSEKKSLTEKATRLIDNGKKKRLFRDVDSRHAMISFMGMNMGYLLMAPFVNSIWEIRDAKKFKKERPKQVVDLFLHGLRVK
jgi:TetR/AcrR family transcriptional regulator